VAFEVFKSESIDDEGVEKAIAKRNAPMIRAIIFFIFSIPM
jgi:hypothetical protein